ncbi:MAG TPA: HAD family phosphatase [Chryseolinea sp.]|nr:HAD family phosphatase [Chryseolinea sp.]HPM29542.1 HAD family phosphatase [Chryseolinea sp.]
MDYAFIFDMDGVLIDSNPFHKIALQQFCKQHGHDLNDEQLREKIYGRTNKDWLRNLFGDIDKNLLLQYADEKEALFRELYKKDVCALEGLIPFLAQLKAQEIPRAIATSAPRSNVDFTFEYTEIGQFFTTVLDESFVTKGKPDPEIYLKSAHALGFDPAQCIVFEDSLSGIEAGKAAGCKVVGITTTHTPEEMTKTDFIIDNFTGLTPQSLISRLF